MKNKLKCYFIGIGGISMSALARLLYKQGAKISGSDINKKINLPFADLKKSNRFENIKNADFVVYNNAIKKNNKDFVLAKKLNKKILSRAKLLGQIAKQYENVIAISGTHGKTSTTEMLAECFINAELKPTVHIGGISNLFKSNLKLGNKKFFITEACEYGDSFLTLFPTVSVILNIQPDHLDYFKTFDNLKKSFNQFALQSEVCVCDDDFNIENKISFGDNGNFKYDNLTQTENGYSFDVYKNNQFYCSFFLNSILKENVKNSLAVIAVCDYFNIDKQVVYDTLKNFHGTQRRLQTIKKSPKVICDYAHLPDEISATHTAVKNFYPQSKIFTCFQPHLYSRTKNFFAEFVKVLSNCTFPIIIKTFPAREKKCKGFSAKKLFRAVKSFNKNALYFSSLKKAKKFLLTFSQKQDIILLLGAGDINTMFN